jgi:hypothetical protein
MSAWRASENFNVFDQSAQADEPGESEQQELSDQPAQPERPAQSEQS